MQRIGVAIIGASGYSGIEATRILAQHPHAELRLVASDRWQGETAGARTGILGPAASLRYAPQEKAADLARECQVALLCTPAEASLELAARLLDAGLRVIDFSGAFRLESAAAFERAYGRSHPHPSLLREAVYGLPELDGEKIRFARLIANPGCYPTAAALALAPLFRAGLLASDAPIIDAASGTTGAGRKATEEMSFSEHQDDFRAYRVLRHQHTPEIAQALSRAAGRPVRLTFTAHLLPIRRGILATCYARLAEGRTAQEVADAYAHIYAHAPFVTLGDSPDAVALKDVVGTNRCRVGFAVDSAGDPGRVVVISAIDNLVKGAAGQAVQNLNLACGFAETAGLDTLRGFHP